MSSGAVGGILGPIEVIEGIAIGTGVGAAISDVVVPKLQDYKNTRWQKYPDKPLDPTSAALAAIKGFPTSLKLAEEAAKSGFDADVFGVLVQNLREHPPLALALQLWRRGYIGRGDVDEYLQRHGFSADVITALIGAPGSAGHLKQERLAPAQIALGIVRSIIDDPGLMPVNLNTAGGKVAAYPVSSIDALQEAADAGVDRERLRVLVGEIGLPMSTQQAASAYFRDIIERSDFNRSILEGDVRPEWADAILAQAREILSSHQYAELELRGYLTTSERRANTAKHGMSQTDSDLLFDVLGRSINVHQIVTGEARGGTYKPPPDTLAQQSAGIPPAFLASLQRGNLRPEYYSLAYANRYTYPSFFAIRGLLTGGVLDADEGYQILLEMGWQPSLARTVADFYAPAAGDGAAKVDARVKTAQTSAITEIRSAYVLGQADAPQAEGWLGRLDVPADVATQLVAVWDVMREVPQKGLTAAQIVKAFKKLPAQWPRSRALDELQQLGLTADDAATLLDE